MARELGMNPKKLGKLIPTAGQAWKAPLPEFVAHCYKKSHGRRMPEKVRTLEQVVEDEERRKELRRAKRGIKSTSAAAGPPSQSRRQSPREHEA
jgi:hypothetical protein